MKRVQLHKSMHLIFTQRNALSYFIRLTLPINPALAVCDKRESHSAKLPYEGFSFCNYRHHMFRLSNRYNLIDERWS